jgi:hypothetical protein
MTLNPVASFIFSPNNTCLPSNEEQPDVAPNSFSSLHSSSLADPISPLSRREVALYSSNDMRQDVSRIMTNPVASITSSTQSTSSSTTSTEPTPETYDISKKRKDRESLTPPISSTPNLNEDSLEQQMKRNRTESDVLVDPLDIFLFERVQRMQQLRAEVHLLDEHFAKLRLVLQNKRNEYNNIYLSTRHILIPLGITPSPMISAEDLLFPTINKVLLAYEHSIKQQNPKFLEKIYNSI